MSCDSHVMSCDSHVVSCESSVQSIIMQISHDSCQLCDSQCSVDSFLRYQDRHEQVYVLNKLGGVIILYSTPPTPPLPPPHLPPLLPPAAPKNIKYEAVKEDLGKIDGVKQAHSLHIWSLTLNKIALSAHLVLGERN